MKAELQVLIIGQGSPWYQHKLVKNRFRAVLQSRTWGILVAEKMGVN